MYIITGVEYKESGEIKRQCGYPSEAARSYWAKVHLYIATVDYSVLPFILMLVTNIAIFIRLRQRDKQYRDCTVQNTSGLYNLYNLDIPVTYHCVQ
jgi:hypothetical protein